MTEQIIIIIILKYVNIRGQILATVKQVKKKEASDYVAIIIIINQDRKNGNSLFLFLHDGINKQTKIASCGKNIGTLITTTTNRRDYSVILYN